MKTYYKDDEGVHFYAIDEEGTALHVLCNKGKEIKHTQYIRGLQFDSTISKGTYLINNIPHWMQRRDLLTISEEEFEEALNTAIFELGIYSSASSCGGPSRVSQRMRMHLRSPKYAGVRRHAVNCMRGITGK